MGSNRSFLKREKAVNVIGNLKEDQEQKQNKGKTLKRFFPGRRLSKSFKKIHVNEKTKRNNFSPLNNENLERPQSCSNLKARGLERSQSCDKLSNITQDRSTPTFVNSSNNATSSVMWAPVTDSNAVPDAPQTVIDQAPDTPKRLVVLQATTGQLLCCLGEFLCRRCPQIQDMSSMDPVIWLWLLDWHLLFNGYQRQSCINPSSLVFLYLLCREVVSSEVATLLELHAVVLTCLYVTCSYMGNEISYPVKPFLVETCKQTFWSRCMSMSNVLSSEMLQMHTDSNFFCKVFAELKNQTRKGEKSRLFTVYRR